jgi:hypothetical protein
VATGTTDNTRVLPFDDVSYIVVYECVGVDGSGYGLCQRRIGPNGTPTGPATQVNTATAGDQRLGEIAPLPKGGCVIVWHDTEGDTKLQARWFDAKAAPLPPEMVVVSAAPGPHNAPAAAISPAGKTVFAWSEGAGAAADVFARAFDGQGQPISTKTGLAQTVANAQGKPSIAVAEGGFVVAWQSKLADGSGEGVYLRKLDQDGQPQGKEVQANVTTQGDQRAPTVAALGGTIAVCWEGWEADGAGSWGVVCRLFAAADLAPSTPEFAPHPASPSLDQTLPAVAMVAKSNVLVAWTAAGVDGAGTAVQAVHVDSGGKPLGPRVQVNRAKQGDQLAPAITVLTGEQVVLAWQSAGQEGKDDVGGVHVRWLAGP